MLDILSMENLSRRQRHFGLSVDYILLPLLLIGFIDLPQTGKMSDLMVMVMHAWRYQASLLASGFVF